MKLMTINQVASVLGVPLARAYGLARRGVIPVVHIGRQVRVPEDGLQEWVREGGRRLSEIESNQDDDGRPNAA